MLTSRPLIRSLAVSVSDLVSHLTEVWLAYVVDIEDLFRILSDTSSLGAPAWPKLRALHVRATFDHNPDLNGEKMSLLFRQITESLEQMPKIEALEINSYGLFYDRYSGSNGSPATYIPTHSSDWSVLFQLRPVKEKYWNGVPGELLSSGWKLTVDDNTSVLSVQGFKLSRQSVKPWEGFVNARGSSSLDIYRLAWMPYMNDFIEFGIGWKYKQWNDRISIDEQAEWDVSMEDDSGFSDDLSE